MRFFAATPSFLLLLLSLTAAKTASAANAGEPRPGRFGNLALVPKNKAIQKNHHQEQSPKDAAFVNPTTTTTTTTTPRGGAVKTTQSVISNKEVIVKMTISTILTTMALMGLFYVGHHPGQYLTNTLGFPETIFGVAPPLYVTFLILTFGSAVVTQLLAGGVSAATNQVLMPTETPSMEWYVGIQKPSWNPPGWLFPIMWLIISKPTQFLALRQMFLAETTTTIMESAATATQEASDTIASVVVPKTLNWVALGMYCFHLALGNTWNDVFFGFQKIGLGLAVIVLFYISLIASTVLFYQETKWAGYFMLPTCGWVTVATLLNLAIYNLNKNSSLSTGKAKTMTRSVAKAPPKTITTQKKEAKIEGPAIPSGVVLAAVAAITMSAKFFFRENAAN